MTEIAPGVDVERAVMAQAAFELAFAGNLSVMDQALFRPEKLGSAFGATRE